MESWANSFLSERRGHGHLAGSRGSWVIVSPGLHTRQGGLPTWPVGTGRSGGCAGRCWTIPRGIWGNAQGVPMGRVLLHIVHPAAVLAVLWGLTVSILI